MMPEPLRRLNPKTLRILVLWAVLVPLFWVYYGSVIHDRGIGGDAKEFIATAYNMNHHGVFSMDMPFENWETTTPRPDAYRPPAYPAFLAGMMRIVPSIAKDDFAWFFTRATEPYAPPAFKTIKYVQAGMLLLASLLAIFLVRELTDKARTGGWWAEAAFIITAVHPFLYRYVNRYYSELMAAFLIIAFTALFYLCAREKKRVLFIACGLLLGVLILTKAQWYYIAIPCTAYFALLGFLRPGSRRQFFTGALIFVLCFTAVILPWKQRNQELFGRSFLTERGGIALDLRSRHVTMTNKEILASFFYWSRTGTIRDLLDSFMDPKDYANLDRETGYYRHALDRAAELEEHHPRAEADRIQFQEAAQRILAHPWGYVKTLPALTYRGLIDANLSVFNILVHGLFWVAAIATLRRRQWEQAAIFLPFAMLVAFDSLVTHNISRYNATGTAVLVVGGVAGAREIWVWWRGRRAARACAGSD